MIARSLRFSLQNKLLLGVAALALFSVACGSPNVKNSPSGRDRHDLEDGPAHPGPGKGDQSTAQLLDKLLADPGTAPPAQGGSPKPPPPAPPPAPPAPSPAPSSDDSFDADTKRIRETVPTWDNGTGITARFLKEATGSRISLIYVDPTPPEFNKDLGLWVIQAKAKGNNKVLGHFLILLKDVNAGKLEGNSAKKDIIMVSQVSEKFDPKASDAMWSTKEGAWCELVLRQGKSGRHLEGTFRAKLVSNDGTSYQTVESGYMYINR